MGVLAQVFKGNSLCGVQEMERAREGVAALLNDVSHSAVIDFESLSSRILWITLKFSIVKVCVVVGCNPNEGIDEERERFWMTWTGLWLESEVGIDYTC